MSLWTTSNPTIDDVIDALDHTENQGDVQDVIVKLKRLNAAGAKLRRALTPGEKAVWAVVFATWRAKCLVNAPTGLHRPGNEAAQVKHEGDAALEAAEHAWAAVSALREAREGVSEGWGADHEVHLMLVDMLNG